jgi:hypothetical protein
MSFESDFNNELFVAYCMDFYGEERGLYPIRGLTFKAIEKATQRYLNLCSEGVYEWGDGDSVDRERVRDILLDDFGFELFVKEF